MLVAGKKEQWSRKLSWVTWKTTLGFFLESRQKKIENNGVAYRQKTELSSPEVTVATEPLECGYRKMSCVASVKYTPDFKGLIKSVTFPFKIMAIRKFKITHVAHIKFLSGGTGRRDLCVLEKNKREWYIKNTYRKHS